MKRILSTLLFAIFFMALHLEVFAVEAPNPPLNFSVTQLTTTKEGYPVEFKWSRNPEGETPNFYIIYYAPKFTDNPEDFKQLKTISYENKDDFSITKYLNPGEYSFFMKAVKKTEDKQIFESQRTEIVQISIEGKSEKFIKITSYVPNEGKAELNKEWKYEVKIETNITSEIKYKLSGEVPEGMTIDENTGVITWTPDKSGYVMVTVIAYSVEFPDIQAKQTFKVKVGTGEEKPKIQITSKPLNEGKALIDKEWKYEVKYTTSLTSNIKFKLTGEIPDGMTIDENTGVVTWTPTQTGYVIITIVAYSEEDPTIEAKQTIKIVVVKDDEYPKEKCAVIKGTVKYEDGTPVPGGKVVAWFTKEGKDEYEKFYSKINSDGTFAVEVAEGKYIIQVAGETFIAEYYENTGEIANASLVEVKCNDELTVDFTVTKKEVQKKFKVSGRVTNADGTVGIYAIVEFFVDAKNNYKDGQDDKKIFQAITDKEGYYTIELLDGYIYVAHAKAKEKGSLYKDEYYSEVATYTEATKLTLTGDLTDINFTLDSYEDGEKGTLSGQVVDESNVGVASQVIAYLISAEFKEDKNFVYKVSVATDDNGNFTLENLYYGDYVIQSVPANNQLYPGYYLDGNIVVKNWKEATRVTIENPDNGPITIKHKVKTGEKGVNKLNGKVKKDKKNIMNTDDEFINGSIIYCIDGFGVIDFAFSDANGDFSLTELPEGISTYVADMVGFESKTGTIDLNYLNNRTGDVVVELAEDMVLSVDNPMDNTTITISPNPAQDYIHINTDSGISQISVFDLLGNNVMTINADGNRDAGFNLQGLAPGIYSLQLRTDKGIATRTFVIAR